MPKLAIYVPKKEMREIEKWRKKINFSQVFMKAVTQEIRTRSRTVNAKGNRVAAAAEYYKQRLTDDSGPLADFGFALGTEHVLACRLDPENIRRLLEIEDSDSTSSEDLVTIESAIGEDKRRIEEMGEQQGYREPAHPTWRTAVYRGYLTGVTAAWKQVCKQM